jgi:Fe(3+) dicitrate transport protein
MSRFEWSESYRSVLRCRQVITLDCRAVTLLKPAGLAVLLLVQGAVADEARSSEDALLEEVLIVGQESQAKEKSGSAHVVSTEILAESNNADVNRILREVPGVYVREEDGYGLRPNIGIRGSGAERSSKISLMEDGVLMAPAPYADPAAYYFPTAGRMSAIEVLKGPEILRYGPFTVGGALNMVSTPIPDTAGGRLLTEAGEYGEKRMVANYGQRTEQVGWLLETVQYGADGFQDIDRSHQDSGFSIQDYVSKLRFNTAADARYYQQLDLKLQYSEETSNMSYIGLTDNDFSDDPNRRYGLSEQDEMNNRHTGGSARYRFELNDQLAFNTLLYQNKFKRDWYKVDKMGGKSLSSVIDTINNRGSGFELLQSQLNGTADVNNVDIKHNNREYNAYGGQLSLDGRFATGALQHKLEFGVRQHEDEIDRFQPVERYNQINGNLVFASEILPTGSNNRKSEANATSIWLADQITYKNFTLLPILRSEDVHTQDKQWADTLRGVMPKKKENDIGGATQAGLGMTWQFTENWQLLAGIHDGFAPPGADSVQGTEPEESVNTEMGVRFQQDAFNAEAIYFRSDYENTVRNCSLANPCTGGIDSGTESLGESEINGLEFGIGYEFSNFNNMVLPVRLSYTYTDAEITKDSDNGNFLEGDNLPDMPENMLMSSVGVVHGSGWDSYLYLSYVDEMCVDNGCERAGGDDRFLKTDSMVLVDWTVGYHLADGVRIYSKVNNLFDEQDIASRKPDGARPNMPRAMYMGLDWKF